MKTGFFNLNSKMYFFKIEDGIIEISNTNGVNFVKFFEKWNCKNEFISDVQELHVNFFPNWNNGIILHNHTLEYIDGKERFEIIGYIEFKNGIEHDICSIDFSFKELNSFFKTNKVFDDMTLDENNNIGIKIGDSNNVTSQKKKIVINNQEIEYYYYIKRKLNTVGDKMLYANSIARFELKNKLKSFKDIVMIYNKLHIYYSYISYRQNILDNEVQLYSIDEENKVYPCGKFYYTQRKDYNLNIDVDENYINKHIINYENINLIEDKIMQAIIDKKIFIRHIPRNQVEGNQISLDRVVNLTSAFEWEFTELFPEGVKHSKQTCKMLNDLEEKLNNLKQDCNSKQKRIINKTIEIMYEDNLEGKLKFAYNKLKAFSKPILDQLISLNEVNNEARIFSELGKLRNDFAHGHMHIEIDSDGVLGAIFLSRFIYVMQLYRLGLDENNIKKCINNLYTKIYLDD